MSETSGGRERQIGDYKSGRPADRPNQPVEGVEDADVKRPYPWDVEDIEEYEP